MPGRVLLVSHEASRTGAPRVAALLTRALHDSGWEVVVVHRWGGPLRADIDAGADRSIDEPWSRTRVALRRHRRLKPISRALERAAARSVVRQVRPDLVWCNTVVSAPYAVAAAATGVPAVVLAHEQPALLRSALHVTGLAGVGAGAGVRWAACATVTANDLAPLVPCPPDQVAVLQSPVDADDVRRRAAEATPTTPPPGPLVVACGTADERKGADVFAAAAEASRDAGDDLTWVWVGRAPDSPSTAVRWIGEVPDAAPWMAAATVFAMPSRAEAFPLVVLEAMALSRPIVASRIDGTVEQLGDDAVFVEPGDATELRREVLALASDPERARRLGEAARRRCDRLWDLGHFTARAAALADSAVQLARPS